MLHLVQQPELIETTYFLIEQKFPVKSAVLTCYYSFVDSMTNKTNQDKEVNMMWTLASLTSDKLLDQPVELIWGGIFLLHVVW